MAHQTNLFITLYKHSMTETTKVKVHQYLINCEHKLKIHDLPCQMLLKNQSISHLLDIL